MVRDPSHVVIHTSVSVRSFAESVVVTVYAIHFPSGDRSTPATFFKRYRSPTRTGRFVAPCATSAEAKIVASVTTARDDSASDRIEYLCMNTSPPSGWNDYDLPNSAFTRFNSISSRRPVGAHGIASELPAVTSWPLAIKVVCSFVPPLPFGFTSVSNDMLMRKLAAFGPVIP